MLETELIERARSRDLEAFEELYRTHVGRVFALCLRLCANRALAEDLTQTAFIRVWEKIKSFRGDSAFSSWLHRLTVNVVYSELRSRRRKEDKWIAQDEVAEPQAAGSTDTPAAAMDLEKAISSLPNRSRRVFVLHDVEGYRHDEIAEMTGIAAATSRVHLHRARKLLKEALTS